MSQMMLPPGMAPPGLDVGGGATPAPPPDPGMLMALLSGAQGGAPPGPDLGPMGGGPPPGPDPTAMGGPPGADPTAGGGPGGPDDQPMSAVEHIQAAMKHLMMAMTQQQDDQMGHGITKGMATLQGLLAGDAKQKLAQRGA
jgi:hypothetical protein